MRKNTKKNYIKRKINIKKGGSSVKKSSSSWEWENLNDYYWECPSCKKKILQEKKVCVSCGKDKPKETKKPKKKKKT